MSFYPFKKKLKKCVILDHLAVISERLKNNSYTHTASAQYIYSDHF